jgi:hypothetical protein
MEVGRTAGQNNDCAGRISLQLIRIELITQANVKHTGNDCVNTILGVFVRH